MIQNASWFFKDVRNNILQFIKLNKTYLTKPEVLNFFGKLPFLMNLKTKLPSKFFLINHATTNNSDYPPLKCYLNEICKNLFILPVLYEI